MEEQNNLTAERSLEIITQQIEQSRKEVARDTGLSLYVAGLCLMAMSLFVGLCILFTGNLAFYLLYITLPIPIIFIDRYVKRNKPKVPASYVGTMVDKTWTTFGIFAVTFFVFVTLYNFLMGHTESPEVYLRLMIQPFRIILLLFGMAITINGYTLKNRWMVWCGIIGGIGGFMWESFCVTQTIAARLSPLSDNTGIANYTGIANGLIPGIMIAVLSFIGLTLPGLKLKRQK